MQPEVSGDPPDLVGAGGWVAWPLLVLAALPVAVTVVVARRVLTGASTVYGDLPEALPLRERVALLLNYSTNDVHLLVPLLALLALVWLARPGARRPPPRAAAWCGAALAGLIGALALGVCAAVGYVIASDQVPGESGFVGPRDSLLEFYGARVAISLLLAAFSAALVVALVAAARRPAPAVLAVPDDPAPAEPEPAEPAAPEPAVVETDPHARFRRPS